MMCLPPTGTEQANPVTPQPPSSSGFQRGGSASSRISFAREDKIRKMFSASPFIPDPSSTSGEQLRVPFAFCLLPFAFCLLPFAFQFVI
jgi:hypothetical protein